MHVKYASRHALYPVPNVFVPAPLAVVVARVRRAADVDVALRAVVALVAPRVVAVVAARDTRVVDVGVVLRAVAVVVARCCVVVRWGVRATRAAFCTVFVLRDVT